MPSCVDCSGPESIHHHGGDLVGRFVMLKTAMFNLYSNVRIYRSSATCNPVASVLSDEFHRTQDASQSYLFSAIGLMRDRGILIFDLQAIYGYFIYWCLPYRSVPTQGYHC